MKTGVVSSKNKKPAGRRSRYHARRLQKATRGCPFLSFDVMTIAELHAELVMGVGVSHDGVGASHPDHLEISALLPHPSHLPLVRVGRGQKSPTAPNKRCISCL